MKDRSVNSKIVASSTYAKARVLYLGSALPLETSVGLEAIQKPLSERYPIGGDGTQQVSGIDSILSAHSDGLQLQCRHDSSVSEWFPIQNLYVCAAVRAVQIFDPVNRRLRNEFASLDTDLARSHSRHPPMFACILRKTSGVRSLQCHAFICKSSEGAMKLVRACMKAYGNRKAFETSSHHMGNGRVEEVEASASIVSSPSSMSDASSFPSTSSAAHNTTGLTKYMRTPTEVGGQVYENTPSKSPTANYNGHVPNSHLHNGLDDTSSVSKQSSTTERLDSSTDDAEAKSGPFERRRDLSRPYHLNQQEEADQSRVYKEHPRIIGPGPGSSISPKSTAPTIAPSSTGGDENRSVYMMQRVPRPMQPMQVMDAARIRSRSVPPALLRSHTPLPNGAGPRGIAPVGYPPPPVLKVVDGAGRTRTLVRRTRALSPAPSLVAAASDQHNLDRISLSSLTSAVSSTPTRRAVFSTGGGVQQLVARKNASSQQLVPVDPATLIPVNTFSKRPLPRILARRLVNPFSRPNTAPLHSRSHSQMAMYTSEQDLRRLTGRDTDRHSLVSMPVQLTRRMPRSLSQDRLLATAPLRIDTTGANKLFSPVSYESIATVRSRSEASLVHVITPAAQARPAEFQGRGDTAKPGRKKPGKHKKKKEKKLRDGGGAFDEPAAGLYGVTGTLERSKLRSEQFTTLNGHPPPSGSNTLQMAHGERSSPEGQTAAGSTTPQQRGSAPGDAEMFMVRSKRDSRQFPRDWYNQDERALPNERAFGQAIRNQRRHIEAPDKTFQTAYEINGKKETRQKAEAAGNRTSGYLVGE